MFDVKTFLLFGQPSAELERSAHRLRIEADDQPRSTKAYVIHRTQVEPSGAQALASSCASRRLTRQGLAQRALWKTPLTGLMERSSDLPIGPGPATPSANPATRIQA